MKSQKGRYGKVKYGKEKICLAYCKPLAKYDLTSKKWSNKVSKEDSGRAFSRVIYNREVGKKAGDEKEKYTSFIMLDGTRVENFSGDGKRNGINSVSGWGMSEYMKVLDNMPDRIKPTAILVDNDGPLEEQSRLLAEYINKLKSDKNCKKVILFGQSKCGCMSIASLKYLKPENLDKLDVQLYQAPFLGTLLASPLNLYKKIDSLYEGLSNNFLSSLINSVQQVVIPTKKRIKKVMKKEDKNFLTQKIKEIYWQTLSRSHMDFDVAELGNSGIPKEYEDRYDQEFLGNMFNKATLERMKQIKVTNITTKCTDRTLKRLNSFATALYASSKLLFDEDVDGMVPLRSSSHIEKVCKRNGIPLKTKHIRDGHHYPTGDITLIKEIIGPIFKKKQVELER